jgi:hypothetical protein
MPVDDRTRLNLGHRQPEFLMMLERGTPPRVVPSSSAEPFAEAVIDLAALRAAVRGGHTIAH